MDFTFWDIVRNLLTGLQWTVLLSLVAFVGGGLIGLLVMTMRISQKAFPRNVACTYIELFQGTPLLMQLFLVFFALAGSRDCPDPLHQRLPRRNLARLRRLHRPRTVGGIGQPGVEPS